jgi:hypothetical protein
VKVRDALIGMPNAKLVVPSGKYSDIYVPADGVVELEEGVEADNVLLERQDGTFIKIRLVP